jgi:ribA/ribD-fused uncharacterized protein
MAEYIFFYRTSSPFSQWHRSKFVLDSIAFTTAEQAMMYYKAVTFGDISTAQQILQNNEPREVKRLGRLVKNFNEEHWHSVREDIVTRINMAKFGQNHHLLKKLLGTGNKILVEASPYDRIWGIGYTEDNALPNKDNWGLNLLGKCLMSVRHNLSNN